MKLDYIQEGKTVRVTDQSGKIGSLSEARASATYKTLVIVNNESESIQLSNPSPLETARAVEMWVTERRKIKLSPPKVGRK